MQPDDHSTPVQQPQIPEPQQNQPIKPEEPDASAQQSPGPVNNTEAPKPQVIQSSPEPGTPYPEPTSGFAATEIYSKNDIESQGKKKKKARLLLVVGICLLLIVTAAGALFYHWYSSQDHSIYSRLSTENYSSASYNVSFKYPSVMSANPQELSKMETSSNSGALAFYTYTITKNQTVAILASYINMSDIIQNLGLSPAQVEKQILAKSGSYVDTLNHANAAVFSDLYPNCNKTVQNVIGQTSLICTAQGTGADTGYVSTIVIGITKTAQYALTLEMPKSVMADHVEVWQKVEKNFTYQ